MKFLKIASAFIFWFIANMYYISEVSSPNLYEKLGSWILGYQPEPGDGGFNALVGALIMLVVCGVLSYATVKGISKIQKLLEQQRNKSSSF